MKIQEAMIHRLQRQREPKLRADLPFTCAKPVMERIGMESMQMIVNRK